MHAISGDEDEATLVAAWERGEVAAFDALYRRHAGPLTGYCQRMLRRLEEAEDVVTEVFEVIARGRFQPGGSFRSYLFTVAHRRCIDVLRRRKTRELAAPRLAVVSGGPPAPDEQVELLADIQRMEDALARLPEANRAALLLYYHQHLSVKEVAEVTASTTEQVKSKLAYGRRLLRRYLEDA